VIGRLLPAKAGFPQDYAAALAQRNAALRRLQLGLSDRDAIRPWTERVVELGLQLAEARRDAIDSLADGFAQRAAELGLEYALLLYEPPALSVNALEERLAADLARGTTGLGPHLDDIRIEAGGRDLRAFGSQGEQRLCLLALLLAEAAALPAAPLVLLDDVLSELDSRRREVLADRIAMLEQVVVTATQRDALPREPAQVVEVTPGQAR
jgi:DNA replication and repair protein RecF